MKRLNISEIKQSLSRVLAMVQAGTVVMVYDRNSPIAKISPVSMSGSDSAESRSALDLLDRAGAILRGGGVLAKLLLSPPPRAIGGADIAGALNEERGDQL